MYSSYLAFRRGSPKKSLSIFKDQYSIGILLSAYLLIAINLTLRSFTSSVDASIVASQSLSFFLGILLRAGLLEKSRVSILDLLCFSEVMTLELISNDLPILRRHQSL